ncbi:hypothetical protein C0580_05030 [Candidatus Parcubacteria bacterium]|nr:MAG: hypothetical protein C0580_05030 [Candidatus Parcubacteria bacterium]
MENTNLKPFYLVFKNIKYILLAFGISFVYILLAVIIPSYSFINFFLDYNYPVFGLPKLVYGFFIANSTVWTLSMTILISILSGINFSMLIFYLKRRISKEKKFGVGFGGMLIGLLGVGCASCGSIILSSIFGFTAATGFLGILPFKGFELGIVGVVLLALSIYFLSRKIENPLLCKIEQ